MKLESLSCCEKYRKDVASVCFQEWESECRSLGIHSVGDYMDAMEHTVVAHDKEWMGCVSLESEDLSTHGHLGPWLTSLYVKPKYRNRGIGKRLVRSVLKEGLYLWCYHELKGFYEKLGFKCIELFGDKYIMRYK